MNPKKKVQSASMGRDYVKFYKHAGYTLILVVLCVIFIILKLPFIHNIPAWDESVYLSMGKYIYSDGDSGLWEMIRPLGLPLITGSFWYLGIDQIIASRIFSLLISAGLMVTVFFIAKELFDKRHALLGAVILAATPIFFYYADYILTDHISTLFLMLSILFIMKDRYVLGGFFGGIAFWFKFTHVLYFGAIMLFILYKILKMKVNISKINSHSLKGIQILPKYILFSIIFIVLIGAYFAVNFVSYRGHFDSGIDAMSRPYIDASAYSDNPYQNITYEDFKGFIYYVSYYIYNIIFNTTYGSLIYIFFIIYLLHMKRFFCGKDQEKHILLGIVFMIYLIYFTIIPYKNDRFWVTFLPFMAIYASFGIFHIMDHIKSSRPKIRKTLRISASIMIIVLFAISLYDISRFYDWNDTRDRPNPDIERYFDNLGINGPILTTDPGLTAYSDKRYVGAYDILNRNGLFVNDWESDMNFTAVIYREDSIPCLENDQRCMGHKADLVIFINRWFTPKDSYIYHGSNVTFYVAN